MRKFLVLTGSLLFIVSLGLGGWWSWPILFPSLPADWLSTLSKADAALLQDRPDLARSALKVLPSSLPVDGWLQWEKRVHAVAVRTQDWKWAAEVAGAAYRQFPGNADLAAYLVWTLLKDRRPAEAGVLAKKVLVGGPWEGLLQQAVIEADGLATGDWSALGEVLDKPSEESFVLYGRLAELAPSQEIRKNALLAALSLGRLDSARNYLGVLTPEQRDLPPFDRLQGLMAYDQGDWTRAATLLKSLAQGRPDTLLVLADVYLHLGDRNQAKIIYDQMLADSPREMPLAMGVNRATLALGEGDPGKALQLLSLLVEINPSDGPEKARLLVLEARYQLGEVEAVRTALDRILEEGDESALSLEAELLKGRLFPDWTSQPRLWSLFHRHPEFSPLAERLAWLLLVDRDYSNAHRVLEIHKDTLKRLGKEPPWWVGLLRALIAGAEDNLIESDEAFASVEEPWRDATFYANWSLVSLVRAQRSGEEQRKPLLDDSLEKLTRALDLLPPGSDMASLQRRSQWLMRRGELQSSLVPFQKPALRGALRSAAIEDFRQAVQLDPENLRASFLLRQALAVTQEPS